MINLVEEIEIMGRSEKAALEINLVVVLMHLLKYLYQSERRSKSWISPIVEHRRRINKALKVSPSLKPYLEEVFLDCYEDAIVDAASETGLKEETFPILSPFTFAEAINPKFQPWNN